ncbi:hypothetical protein D9M71_164200 [compost metagenome]
MAQQARGHSGTEPAPTQAITRLADQYQAGTSFGGVLNQGARHFAGAQHHHFPSEPLSQLLGALQAQARLFVTQRTVVDMHQAPGQVPTLGDPAGMAYQPLGLGIAIDAHQQAPTQGRRRLPQLPIALGQVGIDLGCRRLHRQLAQGCEVGLGKERIDSCPRLFGYVDLALAQALEQLPGRQVDQHQFEGFLQHPIGQSLAHLHASDATHLVIEAFQVLDVDCGVDVDTRRQQLLHVLPALGMAAARGVAVGQFVDQGQLRRGLEQAIQVHFFEHDPAVLRTQQRLLRKACKHRFGFRPAVGLDHGCQHRDTLAQLGMGRLQHRVGLAHPRGGAEEDLEAAATFAGQFSEQRIGAGGLTHGWFSVAGLKGASRSSAVFNASMLTTAGPINGCRVYCKANCCKVAAGMCRAAATRANW